MPFHVLGVNLYAHQHQRDKGGARYILHPLRVMLQLDSEPDQIVAVLHDLLEDTPWTRGQLEREGFSPEVLAALEALCKGEHESYDDFIDRVSANHITLRVKMADLADNMDLSRIPKPTPEDHDRVHKYRQAHGVLAARRGSH